jgi:hypothetical protein
VFSNYLKTLPTSLFAIVRFTGEGLVWQETVEKEYLLGAEDLVEEGLDESISIERSPGSRGQLN